VVYVFPFIQGTGLFQWLFAVVVIVVYARYPIARLSVGCVTGLVIAKTQYINHASAHSLSGSQLVFF
jgi:hypothetical protein